MQQVDPEPGKKGDKAACWARRIVLAFLIIIAVVVSVVVVLSVVGLYQERQSLRKFEAATSEAKLLGKTPDQIIALLGTPYYDSINDPKTWPGKPRTICYLAAPGEVCCIEFDQGVAANVDHRSR